MIQDRKICGQCNKQMQQKCLQQQFCSIHNSLCYSCRNCQQLQEQQQSARCQQCQCRDNAYKMFLDIECGESTYFCKKEFVNKNITQIMMLPCQIHKISLQQYLQFMKNYCYKCARTIINPKINSKSVNLCYNCQYKDIFLKQINQQQLSKKVDNQIADLLKIIDSQSQKINLLQKNNGTNCFMQKDGQRIQLIEKNKTIQSKLTLLTQKINKISNLIGSGSDFCQICFFKFDLQIRMPYLICMRQHIICKACLDDLKVNKKNCPWCMEQIFINKVMPFRYQKKIIQIQKIIKSGQHQQQVINKQKIQTKRKQNQKKRKKKNKQQDYQIKQDQSQKKQKISNSSKFIKKMVCQKIARMTAPTTQTYKKKS